MKLRIGILVEELQCLSNWQLRVIQDLLNRSEIEVVLILQSNRVPSDKNAKINFFSKIVSYFKLAHVVLQRQLLIEEILFFPKPNTIEIKDIISQLTQVSRVSIEVTKKNEAKVIPNDDIKKIENTNLDAIINLDGIDGLEEISRLPTFGIWSFMFTDSKLDRQGPTGFWEVLHKHEGIGFSLLRQTNHSDEKQVIDSAFFNRGWSITETQNTVQEGAVSVFTKAMDALIKDKLKDLAPQVMISAVYQKLSVIQVTRYCFYFYSMVLKKSWEKFGSRVFSWRPERWSIFLGTGIFLNENLSSSAPLDMPSDEFWADPFLFKHKNSTYVFFENYSYRSRKGKISCGRIEGNGLIDIIDVLEFDYHLSFPYIFEENGEIYLMPESSENERLEIYRAIEFPRRWELYSTGFEGERVADAFFHTDENKQKWLFLNKQVASTSPMNSELYIYKVDSFKLNSLEPHAQNPVIIDARVARNGGTIFKHEGKLYRPSQRNTDAIYGRALNINNIEKLTISEYSETTEQVVRPDFDKKLMAMHHVHQLGETYVFDAAYQRK